jgi:hypothetical protein
VVTPIVEEVAYEVPSTGKSVMVVVARRTRAEVMSVEEEVKKLIAT